MDRRRRGIRGASTMGGWCSGERGGREIERPGISARSNCRLKTTLTMQAHLLGGKERGRGNGSETTGWAVGLKPNWAAQSSFSILFFFLLSFSSFLIS
jgi:hypothetical protein